MLEVFFFISWHGHELRSLCDLQSFQLEICEGAILVLFLHSALFPHWCSSDEKETLKDCHVERKQIRYKKKLKLRRPLTSAPLFSHRRLSLPFLSTP